MRMDYSDKQVVVVGAGLSGCGLARYFRARGARTILSDQRRVENLPDIDAVQQTGAELDLGGHTAELFEQADLVAISPGVPLTIPPLEAARRCGVPILGEIEVAWRELDAPVIGITGTNGKSTVTTLMGNILKAWRKETFVGGNLGTPLINAVEQDWDWLVVELSSFQLEAISKFHPHYAVLLNISEDHLDRYPDMESYQAAKAELFRNLTTTDIAILNADDPLVQKMAGDTLARRVFFSGSRTLAEGMGSRDGTIVWNWRNRTTCFDAGDLKVRGQHNVENVMAAMIPPLLEGCPVELAWSVACEFSGLPHRMEVVAEFDGLRWINDSKGTNIGSVVKSLQGLEGPITLIAGGKDKQGDLAPLADVVAAKVETLVLIGDAAARMKEAFSGLTEIHRAATMTEAVALAARETQPGGTILLSPGCSSFDMFRSYEERGDAFVKAVRTLMPQSGEVHGS